MIPALVNQPTLEEFRSSRITMSWSDAAKLLRIDPAYTDAPRALVYMNSVFIEDYGYKGHEDVYRHKGQYVLIVGKDIHCSDDLPTLEQILYEYMIEYNEGFPEKPKFPEGSFKIRP